MKHIIIKLACVCVLSLLLAASCKKNKDSDPLAQLPPETQTGANTFGCLVNGSVFKPKSTGSLLPILSSYYQLIYPASNGYVFNVTAIDERDCCLRSVYITIDSLLVQEGNTYLLNTLKKGTAGGATRTGADDNKRFATTESVFGELYIKKFDKINQIVAGTFWFNAINPLGDTVKITNGRFDMKYTR